MRDRVLLKRCQSFLCCLCLFLLLIGCSPADQSKAPGKPKPSVGIGDVGTLAGNMNIISTKEQAIIQRAVAAGNNDMKLQDLVARMVVANSKLQESNTSPVAVSDAAMGEFSKAMLAHDSEGVAQMLIDGSLFVVGNGTEVRVIDHGGTGVSKIRILAGSMRGSAGYVPDEWVKPIPAPSK